MPILVGPNSGQYNRGNYIVATGYEAGNTNAGDYILALGYQAGYNNTGDDVIAIGYQAGWYNNDSDQFILKQANVNSIPLIQGDFVSGSVGINTSSPATALHVEGDLGLNFSSDRWLLLKDLVSNPGIVFPNSTGLTFNKCTTDTFPCSVTSIHMRMNGTGTYFPYGGGNFTVSDNLYIDVNTNRVGINTETPGDALHVISGSGGSGFSGPYSYFTSAIFESSNGLGSVISVLGKPGGFSGINFGDNESENVSQIRYYHTDDSLRFKTNGSSDWMILDADGNLSVDGNTFNVFASQNRVGVGTATPKNTLQIIGDLNVTGTTGSIVTSSTGNQILFSNTGSSYLTAFGSLELQSNGGTTLVILNSSTLNVGIGTTKPQNKLNVVGDLNATGTLYWYGTNVSAYNSTMQAYANDTFLNVDGSDTMEANLNFSYYNATQVDCIIFKTGGKICTA
jgi:hypothetical protein